MLKKMLQCKRVIPLMATLFSSALVTSAEAITVNLDGNQNITSVEDIQIVETGVQLPGSDLFFTVTSTYRVDFLLGSFDDIFGTPPNVDTSCNLGESNKLCFWQNDPQAQFVINQMNNAFNALDPTPSLVAGTVINPPPFPIPNTGNVYLVALDFDGNNIITSRQGRNDDTNTWVTDTLTTNRSDVSSLYAGATLTAQETVAEIPESSHVMGIIVIGLSMILVTKKK